MKNVRWRRVFVLGVPGGLAVGVIAAVVVALAVPAPSPDLTWQGDRSLLDPRLTSSSTGTHTTVTDNLVGYGATVRIGTEDKGRLIDPLTIECHGGRAIIVWHVGNLEPIQPDTGLTLSAVFDGKVVGSLIRGSSLASSTTSPSMLWRLPRARPAPTRSRSRSRRCQAGGGSHMLRASAPRHRATSS